MTEEMKENDATRYVVVQLARVGPNRDHDDPMTVISHHDAQGDAEKMAKDEAMKDEHDRTYVVYQKIGSARASREVTWKGARP